MKKKIKYLLVFVLLGLYIIRVIYVNKNSYDVEEIIVTKQEELHYDKYKLFNITQEPSVKKFSEEQEREVVSTNIYLDIKNVNESRINIRENLVIYEKYKDFTNLVSWEVENDEILPNETKIIKITVEFVEGNFWDYYDNYKIGETFSLLFLNKYDNPKVYVLNLKS